jgi:general secretion pathway protein E
MNLKMMLEKKILQQLVSMQRITFEQSAELLRRSVEEKINLEKIILAQGLATADEIATIIANEMGIEIFDSIIDSMIDPTLLAKIPFRFLRQNNLIIVVVNNNVILLSPDPRDIQLIDNLRLLIPRPLRQGVCPRAIIQEAINKYYPFNTSQDMLDELKDDDDSFNLDTTMETQDLLEMANDAPIVKLVNHLIFQAVKEDASDIHIEPFEKEISIRYRVDGVMHKKTPIPPKRYHDAIVSRIKIMSNLNIAEKRLPQDGRIQVKVADKAIDLRISILPCNYGERVVMRILDKSKGTGTLESLDINQHDYALIGRMIERPYGIILVSGPTGSGKTTTLYSVLKRLNNSNKNIITVEDPVEYTMHGVSQVQVNEKTGLTFASALRSILRQDPDIALIGEIRDKETAQIATQAALTGHLVLSTIHTNSAPATISRLIDMGVEPFLIASSLACVIAQRLVRALCGKCKEAYTPKPELLARLAMTVGRTDTIFRAKGCAECLSSGYKGRLAIFEVMAVDDELAGQIVKHVDATVLRKMAIAKGMTTLSQDGVSKIKKGLTTVEEVLSVAFAAEADNA